MAERLVKVEGTSGVISDIVVDSKGTWYIVKDGKLHYSLDQGISCFRIELPSKKNVYPLLGQDKFDNIYVQDSDLSVFLVAPRSVMLPRDFSFEEIKLAFGRERFVSRPFHESDYNDVYLTTESGLMSLKNGYRECKEAFSLPNSKGFPRCVPFSSSVYTNGKFFSGGGTRHWIYRLASNREPQPIHQTRSYIRSMDGGYQGVFFTVFGENELYFVDNGTTPNFTRVAGIIRHIDFNKFVAYSPMGDYKTYIYCNVGSTATIHELGEMKVQGKCTYKVVSTVQLEKERLLCSISADRRLFFGTSDGIYELINIGPKFVADGVVKVEG